MFHRRDKRFPPLPPTTPSLLSALGKSIQTLPWSIIFNLLDVEALDQLNATTAIAAAAACEMWKKNLWNYLKALQYPPPPSLNGQTSTFLLVP